MPKEFFDYMYTMRYKVLSTALQFKHNHEDMLLDQYLKSGCLVDISYRKSIWSNFRHFKYLLLDLLSMQGWKIDWRTIMRIGWALDGIMHSNSSICDVARLSYEKEFSRLSSSMKFADMLNTKLLFYHIWHLFLNVITAMSNMYCHLLCCIFLTRPYIFYVLLVTARQFLFPVNWTFYIPIL